MPTVEVDEVDMTEDDGLLTFSGAAERLSTEVVREQRR